MIMPTLAKNDDRHLETAVCNISSSTTYIQPWWRVFGNSSMPSSGEQANCDVASKGNETNVASQPGS